MRAMNSLTTQRVRKLMMHLVIKPEAANPVRIGNLC